MPSLSTVAMLPGFVFDPYLQRSNHNQVECIFVSRVQWRRVGSLQGLFERAFGRGRKRKKEGTVDCDAAGTGCKPQWDRKFRRMSMA